jgi:hypothetical protein
MWKVAVWLREENAHLIGIDRDEIDRLSFRWPILLGLFTPKRRKNGTLYIVQNRRFTIEPFSHHGKKVGIDGAQYYEAVSQP